MPIFDNAAAPFLDTVIQRADAFGCGW